MKASSVNSCEKRDLLKKIMNLKLGYFGHIMRDSGSPLTKQIVEGMVERKGKEGGRGNSGTTISENGLG